MSGDLDAVLGETDVVYLLRIQSERMQGTFVPSLREYRRRFGLSRERAARLAPDALVMHPGPMNRGVEIDAEVADLSARSSPARSATASPVRMAVLFLLLGRRRSGGLAAPEAPR